MTLSRLSCRGCPVGQAAARACRTDDSQAWPRWGPRESASARGAGASFSLFSAPGDGKYRPAASRLQPRGQPGMAAETGSSAHADQVLAAVTLRLARGRPRAVELRVSAASATVSQTRTPVTAKQCCAHEPEARVQPFSLDFAFAERLMRLPRRRRLGHSDHGDTRIRSNSDPACAVPNALCPSLLSFLYERSNQDCIYLEFQTFTRIRWRTREDEIF